MATTRKTTTSKATAEAVPEAEAAEAAEARPAALEKSALIDEVVIASGVRKRDAKPVIEAALAVIGRALDEGRQVKVAPLGALRVVRSNDGGTTVTHTMKLRRKAAQTPSEEVAADADAG